MPSSSSRESNDANQESINTTIMADIDCDTVNKEEPVTIEDNSMELNSTEASFPDNTDELAASVVESMSDNYEEPVSVEASRSDQTEESEETFNRPHRVNDLPGRKFLSARDIFQKKPQKDYVFEVCPPGNKYNSWILVENSGNTSISDNKRSYYDDCGVWDSSKGRTHIQHYQLSDNFRTVYLKDGVYCIRQRIKGQTVWTPVDPQPPPMEIVSIHRYETVLKSNNNFKKHVSRFTSATDQSMSRIALYEYLGTYDLP
jgi:hypothetical protein